jgi:hypothetical protein
MSSIEFLRKNLPSLFEYDENNFYTKLFDEADISHKKEVKDAYNQGYREGLEDVGSCWLSDKDVAECSNAENYYNENFNK